MTVCVAVCVHDGIVFAADSATSIVETTVSGASSIRNVYRHGNKVFNLVKGLPVCAMTAGMGSIGNAPIHALVKDFRHSLGQPGSPFAIDPDAYSIEAIAASARTFLYDQRYLSLTPLPPPPHSLEFWIGGYSAKSETHELWKITIENGQCPAPEQLSTGGGWGIHWGAQAEPIQRLVIGFDQTLVEALSVAGVSEDDMPHLLGMIRARSTVGLVDAAMPIQDAIDLADFLVDVTKRFYRFKAGADTVGGDTDIAAVTRHERFKWIKRKHYYPMSLNVETDHA